MARASRTLLPLRDGAPFFAIGDASGFPHDGTRLKEHGEEGGTGGHRWGTLTWDHWPVGWLNSQAHDTDAESLRRYPNHFAPFGLDLWSLPDEETEGRAFYSLLGVAGAGGGADVEAVRALVRQWLQSRPTDPAAVAALPSPAGAPGHR